MPVTTLAPRLVTASVVESSLDGLYHAVRRLVDPLQDLEHLRLRLPDRPRGRAIVLAVERVMGELVGEGRFAVDPVERPVERVAPPLEVVAPVVAERKLPKLDGEPLALVQLRESLVELVGDGRLHRRNCRVPGRLPAEAQEGVPPGRAGRYGTLPLSHAG